jgi:hypothetical protein
MKQSIKQLQQQLWLNKQRRLNLDNKDGSISDEYYSTVLYCNPSSHYTVSFDLHPSQSLLDCDNV